MLSFFVYLTSSLGNKSVTYEVVCGELEVALTFAQTCRYFHGVLGSKYLWQRLMSTAEFLSSFISHMDPNKLSARALQDAAIKTLRLERNWRRKIPILRNVYPIRHDTIGSFDHMKFLPGAETLVAVRRERHGERPSFQLCVFSLSDPRNAYEAASFQFRGTLGNFDVALADDTRSFIFAFTFRTEES